MAVNNGSGNAYGIFAHNGSTIEIVGDVNATANSGSAYGVDLGTGTNSLKTVNNIKATTTSGEFAVGLMSRPLGAASNNTLTVAGNVEAVNNGSGEADGISNINPGILETKVGGNIIAKSAGSKAVAVASTSSGNTTVTVTGTATAEAPNGNASVTYNNNTGKIILNAGAAMSAAGNMAGGATDIAGGTTTINGGGNTLTVKGTASSAAVQVANGSTVNLNNVTADAQAPDGQAYSIYDAAQAA